MSCSSQSLEEIFLCIARHRNQARSLFLSRSALLFVTYIIIFYYRYLFNKHFIYSTTLLFARHQERTRAGCNVCKCDGQLNAMEINFPLMCVSWGRSLNCCSEIFHETTLCVLTIWLGLTSGRRVMELAVSRSGLGTISSSFPSDVIFMGDGCKQIWLYIRAEGLTTQEHIFNPFQPFPPKIKYRIPFTEFSTV